MFEKVYKIHDNKIKLRKLAFRKQSTIHAWETSKSTPGVQQQLNQPKDHGMNEGESLIDIPAGKLLRFTFDQEGDNYEGVSLLRPLYRHYYIADKLVRLDAIKNERISMPVPTVYAPSSIGEKAKAQLSKIVKNVRNHHQVGIRMPGSKDEGYLFEYPDMKAQSSSNILESVKYHERKIFMLGLAQFLLLGTESQSGSRALSEDHSDLFLLSLTFIADYVCEVFNRYLIPELVNLNYTTDTYPKLKFQKIGSVDYEKLANVLDKVLGGMIDKDEEIEQFVREAFDLPQKKKDDTQPQDPKKPDQDPKDPDIDPQDPNAGDDKTPGKPDPKKPPKPAKEVEASECGHAQC